MAIEFRIGDFSYQASKIDAMTQFNIVRRLAPVLTSFGEIKTAAEAVRGGGDFAALTPIVNAIAKMSDEDTNYVCGACLAVVVRRQNNGQQWAPVWNSAARRPQFDDIDMLTMIQIVVQVIQGALAGFFPGALSTSLGA